MFKKVLISLILFLVMGNGLAGQVSCPGKYTYSCCAVLDGSGKPTGRVEHYKHYKPTDNGCPGGYRSIPCTEAEAADSSKIQGVACTVVK